MCPVENRRHSQRQSYTTYNHEIENIFSVRLKVHTPLLRSRPLSKTWDSRAMHHTTSWYWTYDTVQLIIQHLTKNSHTHQHPLRPTFTDNYNTGANLIRLLHHVKTWDIVNRWASCQTLVQTNYDASSTTRCTNLEKALEYFWRHSSASKMRVSGPFLDASVWWTPNTQRIQWQT